MQGIKTILLLSKKRTQVVPNALSPVTTTIRYTTTINYLLRVFSFLLSLHQFLYQPHESQRHCLFNTCYNAPTGWLGMDDGWNILTTLSAAPIFVQMAHAYMLLRITPTLAEMVSLPRSFIPIISTAEDIVKSDAIQDLHGKCDFDVI